MYKKGVAVTLGGATLMGVLAVAYVVRSRTHPSACPYAQSLVLELPRPFFTRARLRRLLAPTPGERVLEVGPGRGYYALDIAPRLLPGGRLDILDLQQEMLDVTPRRAAQAGIASLVPTRGDARALPYPTTLSMEPTWWPRSARCPTRTPPCASCGACSSRAAG